MIVVLNGAPRSGKSSIVAAIQETFEGSWMNLGVDIARATTPPRLQPGIGLRPGEPQHPAAPSVPVLYAAFWESVAAHGRLGLDVAVDVGLYDRAVAADAARRLHELDVVFVGVHCPLDEIMKRRAAAPGEYAQVRGPAARWDRAVHPGWRYDVEVDTSLARPVECADAIAQAIADGRASAFHELGTFLA